ncbi:hypothetical protein [Cohnella sp. 56]|uniref:hypothetical protein n=1 Tax=Cohnella sp. 56 TaxID=3113722 RepID=UPI0030E8869E
MIQTQTEDIILVAAPTPCGERFIQALQARKIPYAALVSDERQAAAMERLGVERLMWLHEEEERTAIPDFPIGDVYIFERSLPQCCRYVQACRAWTAGRLFVISHRCNPRMIYRGLGADRIVLTNGDDVSFLIRIPDSRTTR